ncbi:MAG: hypothetical protein CL868_21110 [Cytophagaceae bacterium]|nr:hypothetical protein [Cytophagaceae bacterium]
MKKNTANVYMTIFLFVAILIAGLARLFQYNITWILLFVFFIVLLINIILTDRLKNNKHQASKE